MNRWLAFAPLIALAALIVVSLVLLTRGDGPRESFTDGLMGRPAPAYALPALYGESEVTSESRRGRAYVINLFASWCGPCRAEHPQLMALRAQGVEIVGVAYKDRPENARRFLATLGDPFAEVGQDPQGRFGLDLGISGVPETFVIGADGRVLAAHRGPLTQAVVDETILPALN